MSKNIKQVIVMRNDLNMRKGKMIAQGAHAAMMFLLSDHVSEKECQWINHGMTKICVRCDSEADLLDIERQAKEAKLKVYVITDAGHTEFNGVPTKTCLAIGPDDSEEIDKITKHLKLL